MEKLGYYLDQQMDPDFRHKFIKLKLWVRCPKCRKKYITKQELEPSKWMFIHQRKCSFRERTWRVIGTNEKTRIQKFGASLKKLERPITKIAKYYLTQRTPGENLEELEKNKMRF